MNSKGFTLIELLVTIALLSVLIVFVVPNVYQYLTEGYSKAIKLQENKVEEAAEIFLEDYCKTPISSEYQCPHTITYNQNGDYTGKICLSVLQDKSNEYIGTISFKKNTCTGYIKFDNNKAKAYLKCGEEHISVDYQAAEAVGC